MAAGDGASAVDGELAELRAAIGQKLDASAAARQESADRRREAAQRTNDPSEDVDAFLRSFEAEIGEVQRAVGDGEMLAGQPEQATQHFDGLTQRAAALNEQLSAAALFLPSYQLRQRQQALAALTEAMAVSRAKIAPKKKFSFAKRGKRQARGAKSEGPGPGPGSGPKPEPEPEPEPKPQLEPEPQPQAHAEPDVAEEFDPAYLLTSKTGVRCRKVAGEIAGHDYAITDMADSTIYLLDTIGALYIKRVRRCRIVTGPIRGSVHINDAHESAISLAARQVRMHTSKACKLHIFCASDPIIEHCSEIGIGCYGLAYEGIEAHTQAAGLEGLPDRRCGVQDFNWLRQTQSPNWHALGANDDAAEGELREKDLTMKF